MSEEEKNLTGHEYDGIREYDNPLPNWWLATFIGSIIFAFIYWTHYEFGGGDTQLQELRLDLATLQSRAASAPAAEVSEEDLKALLASGAALAGGHDAFQAKCAVCHGTDLQGIIGPNLVDDYWLHGQGRLADIHRIIHEGVTEKGMPAWGAQLPPDEIRALVAYIASKRGSTPPNAKAPQGEKFIYE